MELYTIESCPYSAEAREQLEWQGIAYVEFDVERDLAARERLLALTGGFPVVPVLVESGKPVQIGWMGRSCAL